MLYLKSASYGLICTLTSLLAVSYYINRIPEYIEICTIKIFINPYKPLKKILASSDFENNSLPFFIMVTIFAFVVAHLWCFIAKHIALRRAKKFESNLPDSERYKIMLMSTILQDSPLDELFFKSYRDDLYLLLSMDDRKIYIGRVLNLGEPTESEGMDQEIVIIPVGSGYRDKDTLDVEITTDYDSKHNITLTLRQDKVISATIFDEEVFDDFMRRKSLRKNKKSRLARLIKVLSE